MQQLHETGRKFIENIKDAYDKKGITDRGGAKDSLSYTVDGNRLIIEGKARIMFNNFGRRGNKVYDMATSWKTLMPFIRPWVARKLGIPYEKNFAVSRAISDKIAREGTALLKGNAKGLELEIIFSEIAEELQQDIILAEQMSITDGLIKTWKK